MKNRQNVIIAVIVAVLVVIIGITALLNKENTEHKVQLNNDAIFTVIRNGVEVKSYNMEQIQALGEVEFSANLKSSGKDPVEYTYVGVPLIQILQDAEIVIEGSEAAIVTGIDGYAVSVSMEKVLDDENVYLTYIRDGKLIESRQDGGDGPYQLIISKDKFSQYWCKYAYSVELD